MTLSSLIPCLRDSFNYSLGDRFGSLSVHDDLIFESLRSGCIERAEIFLEGYADSFGPVSRMSLAVEKSIRQLPPELAARVVLSSLSVEFPRTPSRFFVSKMPEFAQLAALRSAVADTFPICSIVHSAFVPNLSGVWLSALCQSAVCDAIVVTSLAAESAVRFILQQAAHTLAGLGPQLPSVVKIPLAADPDLPVCEPETAKAAFGFAPSDVVVLYLGRLTPEYKADLEPLLRAFASLHRVGPNRRLLIAGSEEMPGYSDRLLRYAQEYSCADRVTIVPNFARFTKALLLGAADIFVSPVDNIQESFGLTILEAMAARLPVVASNWSGYRDLVEDGVSGFLIDTCVYPTDPGRETVVASAAVVPHLERYMAARTVVDVRQLSTRLNDLAQSAELRRRMGEAGRARMLESFTWQQGIARFAALWLHQIETSRSCAFPTSHISLREAMDSYPTAWSTIDRLVVRGTHDALDLTLRRHGPDDIRTHIIRRAFPDPVPVRDFRLGAQTSLIHSAIVSLLKAGLLEVVSR